MECLTSVVQRGAERGVMIVLQNHHDFVKTAEDVLTLRRLVPSDWFGLNVDIGSLRMGDPYAEIAKLAPYAYTWQLKERLYRRNQEEKTDVAAIVRIIRDAGYRGYVPIETLGPGDAREKVRRLSRRSPRSDRLTAPLVPLNNPRVPRRSPDRVHP